MHLHAIELDIAACDVLRASEDDLGLVGHAQEREVIDRKVEDICRQIIANRYFPAKLVVLESDWENVWR